MFAASSASCICRINSRVFYSSVSCSPNYRMYVSISNSLLFLWRLGFWLLFYGSFSETISSSSSSSSAILWLLFFLFLENAARYPPLDFELTWLLRSGYFGVVFPSLLFSCDSSLSVLPWAYSSNSSSGGVRSNVSSLISSFFGVSCWSLSFFLLLESAFYCWSNSITNLICSGKTSVQHSIPQIYPKMNA